MHQALQVIGFHLLPHGVWIDIGIGLCHDVDMLSAGAALFHALSTCLLRCSRSNPFITPSIVSTLNSNFVEYSSLKVSLDTAIVVLPDIYNM